MSGFDAISRTYRAASVLQKSVGERALELLAITGTEDVLDLGCGTGHLSERIRQLTSGLVVGRDPSAGMIAEARRGVTAEVLFELGSAEDLADVERFDAIYSNSAMQWFGQPALALANCYRALRSGGRMAVQAPARHDYCPNFIAAFGRLRDDPRTAAAGRFRSPWFFLDSSEAYAGLFAGAGFEVVSARIETFVQHRTPAEVMSMFASGAAAAYLSPDCYEGALPDDYLPAARERFARAFAEQAGADGQVELVFHRIMLLARKP